MGRESRRAKATPQALIDQLHDQEFAVTAALATYHALVRSRQQMGPRSHAFVARTVAKMVVLRARLTPGYEAACPKAIMRARQLAEG